MTISLREKLGLESGLKACFLQAPADYLLQMGVDPQFHAQQNLRPKTYFIHFFAKNQGELTWQLPHLKAALTLNGMLWISWPKKSSGMETDLSEQSVRKMVLKTGLVDVKVASIDKNWSGMKFVYRLKDRAGLA